MVKKVFNNISEYAKYILYTNVNELYEGDNLDDKFDKFYRDNQFDKYFDKDKVTELIDVLHKEYGYPVTDSVEFIFSALYKNFNIEDVYKVDDYIKENYKPYRGIYAVRNSMLVNKKFDMYWQLYLDGVYFTDDIQTLIERVIDEKDTDMLAKIIKYAEDTNNPEIKRYLGESYKYMDNDRLEMMYMIDKFVNYTIHSVLNILGRDIELDKIDKCADIALAKYTKKIRGTSISKYPSISSIIAFLQHYKDGYKKTVYFINKLQEYGMNSDLDKALKLAIGDIYLHNMTTKDKDTIENIEKTVKYIKNMGYDISEDRKKYMDEYYDRIKEFI